MGTPRAPSNGAPRLRGGEVRAACAAVSRETVMAPGSILAAQHSPEFLETNIVPVSLLDGRPTLAISSGPCGAPLARHRSRRCGAEPRQQGACRAGRQLHRVVRRLAAPGDDP